MDTIWATWILSGCYGCEYPLISVNANVIKPNKAVLYPINLYAVIITSHVQIQQLHWQSLMTFSVRTQIFHRNI